MTIHAKNNISISRALDILNGGLPLIDFFIDGEILIVENGIWEKEVIIENCIVEYFSGSVTCFDRPVKLINSHFKNCQFTFTHFWGGLTIDNCTFDNYLDFQAGGHNKPENLIRITNTNFEDFVNFCDCWYKGSVKIENNNFQKGTNIESNKKFITFDFPPTIEKNIGNTKIESEFAEEQFKN